MTDEEAIVQLTMLRTTLDGQMLEAVDAGLKVLAIAVAIDRAEKASWAQLKSDCARFPG